MTLPQTEELFRAVARIEEARSGNAPASAKQEPEEDIAIKGVQVEQGAADAALLERVRAEMMASVPPLHGRGTETTS